MEIRDADFNLCDEKTFYARPKSRRGWTSKAEEIHGFSYGEAMAFPETRKTAIEILYFLLPFKQQDNSPLLFVSHDINSFDFRHLESFFAFENLKNSFDKVFNIKNKESTINMARNAGYSDNKLDIWADRIGFELDHHEAESDRKACSKVYRFLKEQNGMAIDKQERHESTQKLLV